MTLVYNDKTKKLEFKFTGKTFIDIFFTYKIEWALIRYVVDLVKSPGNLSQDDSAIIRSVIEEGRKQNVDEMEIQMSRDVALGINVDGIEGVDVTLGSKGKTNYVMKIKYKSDN
ncbi:MAG: hypothetical protein F6K26_22130 [Moorea sp. SIO2I5]|nr:hypothetical protein [Moorena sp. SIO2I5]